jgi:hypothetical protein
MDNTFFLCEKKTFKKDRKLKKIQSNDRRNNLLEFAVFKNDQRIIKILDSEEFIDNAVYHSVCITPVYALLGLREYPL